MTLGQITSSLDPAQAQAAYYALQEHFNIGWAVNQLIAISLPILLFFSGWGSSIHDFLLKHPRVLAAAAFVFSLVAFDV